MATHLGWRIFLRSMFVQSSWNFVNMQNLGFFLLTWPAHRGRRHEDLMRRMRQFNTHPYFAGLVAATVIREEERAGEDATTDGLKRSLMCTLGAVGDEFFWATLRPFAAVAALPAAVAGVPWAPLVLLVLYNVPHLAVRAWGIKAGLEQGRRIIETLQRRPLSRTLPVLGGATTALSGFLVGSSAADARWGLLPGHGLASVGVAATTFLVLFALQVKWLGQGLLLACLSALAAVAAAVRVAGAP